MKTHLLGDCHLGKKFDNGCPLHRRGDREKMQFDQFVAELEVACDLHIQVGDLFDRYVVPYSVVYRTAMAYRAAAKVNPDTTYVVLRGNHDASRDADRVSAFQLFAELVRPFGVEVVDEQPLTIADHVFIPWHPFITAAEMIDKIVGTPKIAVGHWDIVQIGDNSLPAAALRDLGIERAITGHDHLKRDLVLQGLPVHVTGSMQPFSHAEDPDGILYVTTTLAELGDVTDKCVRLVLAHDEILDEAIDCLQLQIVRGGVDDVDLGDVDFEAFDLATLFEQAREEVGLDEAFGGVVLKKLDEARAERG
jgi:hypothetical protein